MFVTANVTEGEVYKFGKIKITGDTIVSMDQVERLVLAREDIRSRGASWAELGRHHHRTGQRRLRLRQCHP